MLATGQPPACRARAASPAEAAVLQFVPAVVDDPTLPYHNTLLGIAVYGMWIVITGFLAVNRFLRSDIST